MEAVELYDIVAEDPKLQEVLRRFVLAERAGRQREYSLGLEWFEVRPWQQRPGCRNSLTPCPSYYSGVVALLRHPLGQKGPESR